MANGCNVCCGAENEYCEFCPAGPPQIGPPHVLKLQAAPLKYNARRLKPWRTIAASLQGAADTLRLPLGMILLVLGRPRRDRE